MIGPTVALWIYMTAKAHAPSPSGAVYATSILSASIEPPPIDVTLKECVAAGQRVLDRHPELSIGIYGVEVMPDVTCRAEILRALIEDEMWRKPKEKP